MVVALERCTSRGPLLMHLLRALHYVSAYFPLRGRQFIYQESPTPWWMLYLATTLKIILFVFTARTRLHVGSSGTPCFSFITGNRLELSRLEIAAQRFFSSGFASSTKQVYQSGQSSYIQCLAKSHGSWVKRLHHARSAPVLLHKLLISHALCYSCQPFRFQDSFYPRMHR